MAGKKSAADTFDSMLRAAIYDRVPEWKEAGIETNDTLYTAKLIARGVFGEDDPAPWLVLEVYDRLTRTLRRNRRPLCNRPGIGLNGRS